MSYEEDVRFVGAFVRGGNWEVGLRVARNVGRGQMPSTAKDFARDAGISVDSVRRYLRAWNQAAADGYVDPAVALTPDTELTWIEDTHTKKLWDYYYDHARYGAEVADAAWEQKHAEPSDAVFVPKRTPTKREITEAIQADPAIRLAARDAIAKSDRENRPAPSPFEPPANTMDEFGKLVLDMVAAKRSLQSALTRTLDIHGFRQEDRREAIAKYVRELSDILTAIEEAASGRSMDEELARLLEEGAR